MAEKEKFLSNSELGAKGEPHMSQKTAGGKNKSSDLKSLDKKDCICNCTCKGKLKKNNWKIFHYSNISESSFYGPTLDEIILNLICCVRLILEKIGIVSPTNKESTEGRRLEDDQEIAVQADSLVSDHLIIS